ncbi:uncharacterized protein VTP21DRAFT_7409 [Calcarisporiella thermophila]|uniref:uncharacterized protein n=1 Tax=Calcarisporiella thermophila TaxID=911321 RepID=UPI0037421A0D
MPPPTSTQILHLYRHLLRTASGFTSYNFRDHALRRTKELFRAHRNETDPLKIEALVREAEKELQSLQRQTHLSQEYSAGRLVVEKRKARA